MKHSFKGSFFFRVRRGINVRLAFSTDMQKCCPRNSRETGMKQNTSRRFLLRLLCRMSSLTGGCKMRMDPKTAKMEKVKDREL